MNLNQQFEPFRLLSTDTFVRSLPDPRKVNDNYRKKRWFVFQSFYFEDASIPVMQDLLRSPSIKIFDYESALRRQEIVELRETDPHWANDTEDLLNWSEFIACSEREFICIRLSNNFLIINDGDGLGSKVIGASPSELRENWQNSPEIAWYEELCASSTGSVG